MCERTDRGLLRRPWASQGGLPGPVLAMLDLRPSGNEPHYFTAVCPVFRASSELGLEGEEAGEFGERVW